MKKTDLYGYTPQAEFNEDGFLQIRKNIPLSEIVLKEGSEFWYGTSQEIRSDKMIDFIKTGGVLPRVSVFGKRFKGDKYQLFDGHARYMAYKKMKTKTIPAIITLVDKEGITYFEREKMTM